MTRFLALFALVILSFSFSHDAEARRFGGSRSLGMQRSAPATPPRQATAAPQQTAKPAAQGNRLMGPLAGLAAGLGLGWLFSQGGLGSVLPLILGVMAAVVLLRLLRSFGSRPAPAGNSYRMPPPNAALHPSPSSPAATFGEQLLPPGFEVEPFLRVAKANFVRLQKANDSNDLEQIRDCTTPDFFAAIQADRAERTIAPEQTDVVTLDAELLEFVTEGQYHVASVRFHGLIRETADGAAQAFSEAWHLIKPLDGSAGWRVAGIQQLG